MQPFLRQYRSSIRFKTVFGLSQFAVSSDHKIVSISSIATSYATIVVILISIAYPYFTWCTFDGMVFDEISDTRAIINILEHIIVAVVFLTILITSLVNRVEHARFLNSFASMFDRWMNTNDNGYPRPWDVRRLFVKNTILGGIFFACFSTLIFLIWTDLKNWKHIVYNMLYVLAVLTELQAVFHVRDFALLLSHGFAECAVRLNNAILNEDGYLATFVTDLEDVKCEFDECFGVYLLLFQLKDFLFLTSIVFFAMVECFFGDKGCSWPISFFVFVFYAPVLAKNVWLVRTIDGMEQNVRITTFLLQCFFFNLAYIFRFSDYNRN